MALKTTEGREVAVAALNARRVANKDRVRTNDGLLPAGSPMHFDCLTCGAEISVPEDYINRPKLCRECGALKELGWLE